MAWIKNRFALAAPIALVVLTALVIASTCSANPMPMPAEPQASQGLPDYRQEVADLADAPGTAGSISAGLFNPAAWGIQAHGGFYLGWTDSVASRAADGDRSDRLTAVAESPHSRQNRCYAGTV